MRKSGWSVACDQSIQPSTRARGRVCGPQSAAIVASGQVPENGMGFPHRQIAILDHRHASMGVQRPKRRRIEPAEVAAGGDVLMGKTELADEPKHFLDVEGAAASPNLEHRRFPLMAGAVMPLRVLAGPPGLTAMTMPSAEPMASGLQSRRHVLVLALKLHAGRERHRLHQR